MLLKKHIYKLLIVGILLFFSSKAVVAQPPTLTVNQDEKIIELLDLKKSMEKDNEITEGYTIQLYYGSKERANGILRSYRNKYASWPASIEYETPNYKVWVGNFAKRIEADRALLEIHQNFPTAFILKPKLQRGN